MPEIALAEMQSSCFFLSPANDNGTYKTFLPLLVKDISQLDY